MSDFCTVPLLNWEICSSAEFRKSVGTSTPLQHVLGIAGHLLPAVITPRSEPRVWGTVQDWTHFSFKRPADHLIWSNRDGPDLGSATTTVIANNHGLLKIHDDIEGFVEQDEEWNKEKGSTQAAAARQAAEVLEIID